jgi:hypothetical protein
MTEKTTPAVAEAPAADERTGTEILKSLSPAQTKKWRETGDLPEAKAEPTAEEKAATEKAAADKKAADDKAAADKAAADAAATGKTAEPDKSAAKPEEARIKELEEQNKKLLAEIETLRKTPPTIAPPKSDAPPKPGRNDVDPKTGQPMYASDEAYQDARDKWVSESASRETRVQLAKEAADAKALEQNKLIEKRLQNSLEIASKKHADFADVLKIETKDGKTTFNADGVKRITLNGVLDAWILDSEIGAELLYHFCKTPEEVDRIQGLSPFAAARELTKLEEKLSGGAAPAPAAKSEASPAATVKVPPAPASSVGGKGTAPVDEEAAAVDAGDFRRYKNAADAAEARRRAN